MWKQYYWPNQFRKAKRINSSNHGWVGGNYLLVTKTNHIQKKLSGTGLLTSKDRKWFQRRRIITPTFHFQILEQFFDIFNRESNKLIHNLKSFVNQGDIDIYRNITLCALDVICGNTEMQTKCSLENSNSKRLHISLFRNINGSCN